MQVTLGVFRRYSKGRRRFDSTKPTELAFCALLTLVPTPAWEKQSVPGGKEAKEGSKVFLTVGETPVLAEVPDLVGLSYPEAENRLEEADLLLGRVVEAPSETVPAGVIISQNPPPGTTLDMDTYVYLTTSVGPPDTGNVGERQASGVTGSQRDPSSEASNEEAAVSAAVRGHYEAI